MKNKKITSEDFEGSKVNEDKETKQKSNAQKVVPWLIVAVVSLVVILTCVLIAYYQVYKSNKQNANILEGVYTSSYASMVDKVNELAVDISKYSTATTKSSKISTIQDMMADCNYVLSGLSMLPINQENVVAATKFFNQINGMCEAYLRQLNKIGSLSAEQEVKFDEVGIVVGAIKSNLNRQNAGMYDTGFSFVDASIFDNTGMNELSSTLGDLTDSNIEYPSMIFDGPFSTALETKLVKGLPDEELGREQAYNYLKDKVYSNRQVQIDFEKETDGDIVTYDFSVDLEGKHFVAQVSKRGCLLITLSGYAEGGDPIMSNEQAIEMAETFANNIGFENMNSVWLEVHENVAYINLASIQNGVILYPDLIKVKVDLTAQDVIGFEAVNYALNHVKRNFEFNVSESEAEKLLGFDYEILKTSKAIIRLDSGKEVAVYEFMVEKIDGMYFYYIDANVCEISKILKLVSIKGVEKLI